MYNVFKGQVVPQAENAKQIIDSNERMEQIFEAHRAEMERQAMLRRKQLVEDFFDRLEFNDEGRPVIPVDEEGNPLLPVDEEGNQLLFLHSDGLLYEEEEVIVEEEPEEEEEVLPAKPEEPPVNREEILAEIQKEADEILANARAEAEGIINHANEQVDAMRQEVRNEAINEAVKEGEQLKEQAKEEGRKTGQEEGYQIGLKQGHDEAAARVEEEYNVRVSEMEADYNSRILEYSEQVEREKEEYRSKEETMERQMADVFCDIIDKVFAIEFSDKKEIILHLVDNVITNTPGSKEYLIRVNDSNYDILHENRSSLIEKVGTGVELDIIKDPLLTAEECQIETDGGVYDCGIDVQFANLIRDLRALSLV